RKPNHIVIQEDGTCAMLLQSKTHGDMWTYFDLEHLAEVTPYRWHVVKTGNTFYCSRDTRENGKRGVTYLHNLVCPTEPGFVPDHLDRDGLNCRNNNLQAKPERSNHHNKRNNTPGFIGVHAYAPMRYQTLIRINQKLYSL